MSRYIGIFPTLLTRKHCLQTIVIRFPNMCYNVYLKKSGATNIVEMNITNTAIYQPIIRNVFLHSNSYRVCIYIRKYLGLEMNAYIYIYIYIYRERERERERTIEEEREGEEIERARE